MYKSVRRWLLLTAVRKPYIKRSGTGAKIFAEPVSMKCYASGKVQVVSNKDGKEVVSNKTLYLDGTEEISELDNIIFEGVETDIKAIGYFYAGSGVDLKVVYL